ncbi:MAG: CRISPR-associated helicase Cas3' [Luteolibacter sp.]
MSEQKQLCIAHVRKGDKVIQTLEDHLAGTASLCALFASSIDLSLCGRLLGLLHDLGKYSTAFQKYIRDVTGLNGEETKLHAEKHDRGSIDHATAGAQIVWDACQQKRIPTFMAQVLGVILMSHHSRSGMIDFIDLNGKSPFLDRIRKSDPKTHKDESLKNAAPEILEEIDELLTNHELVNEFKNAIKRIQNTTTQAVPTQNSYALLARYLFSCLLDADRLNTANFENPASAEFRTTGETPDWSHFLHLFEAHLAEFKCEREIDRLRSQISNECRAASTRCEKLLTLQVPTGGGKTLASLRFALHRAASSETHRVDRIIYILPYTSILDQNAEVARKILGSDSVLEHHSNLSEEKDSWKNRVLSENWDAPIVFTTCVQFLNALFAAGTKTARRMHQLDHAILIFDEIQSLPIKTIHLFNNAVRFLCEQCDTTAVLCTATMPLLNAVSPQLGNLPFTDENEILTGQIDLTKLQTRVKIVDDCRPQGWTNKNIAEHAKQLQQLHRSLLIVCNTKPSARALFDLIKNQSEVPVVHLSTNMCPAHRKHKIEHLRSLLDPENPQPVICVSTQLIEAGVDLDFGCVIRSLTGLDSIIQAAGRCNRHGHRDLGYVHVLNFSEENLPASLKDITLAQNITKDRVFDEFERDPERFDRSLLSTEALNLFYTYYFYQRTAEMLYPCAAGKGNPPLAQECNLLDLLSQNNVSKAEAERISSDEVKSLPFKQAFSTAAQAFQVIDAPTQGILVPYDEGDHQGSKIIADLAASYTNEDVTLAQQVRLHKQAQQYTVNAFPHVIKKLSEQKAIRETQPGQGIYHLDECYYHKDLGVTLEALSEQHFLNVSS